jgi:iron complex outermembrane receptor protein
MNISRFLVNSCALIGGAWAMPALAQIAPETGAAASTTEATVQDIIVTARRRNERLQDVPVAISAYDERDLSRYSTGSVNDIASQTPQLVISAPNGPGGSSINLRGVGSASTTSSVDQAVSINIDGVQVSQSNFIALGTYDLDHVEILKGPQALFFGKNSPGGVISLSSADPGRELEWRLRTSYDFNNEGLLTEGMISAPLTDMLGVRIAAAYKDQDGWFKNLPATLPGTTVSDKTSPKSKEYFIRGTLKYGADANVFNAGLKFAYGQTDRDNGLYSNGQLLSCPGGTLSFPVPGLSADCKLDRYYSEPNLSPGIVATAPDVFRDGRPYFENRLLLTSLTANLKVADALTLTSVTGYLRLRERFTANYNENGFSQFGTASDQLQRQFTQEVRLASSFENPLNFTLGAFYQNAKLSLAIPTTLAAGFSPTGSALMIEDDEFGLKTEAYSVFGQLIWKFASQWELAGGARYSHETKSENARSLLFGVPYPFLEPKRSFNNVSPEATLSFRPSRNLTLYAGYRRGFTSGGYNLVPLAFNPFGVNDNGFKQSTVQGGELGAKGSIAQGQIQFDLSVYEYKYKDLQLSTFDSATAAISLRNAGRSRVRGVELSANVRPDQIEGLTVRGSVAYNDARYTLFNDAGCYTGQTVAQGCSGNVIGGVAQTQSLTGSRLERAPEWSLNFGASYDHPITSGITFGLTGDAYYTGSFFSESTHDPRATQHEAWRLNAGVNLRGPNNGWELALIGRNLSNVLRAEYAFGQPFTGFGTGSIGPSRGADLVGVNGMPRSVVLQLTLRNTLFK